MNESLPSRNAVVSRIVENIIEGRFGRNLSRGRWAWILTSDCLKLFVQKTDDLLAVPTQSVVWQFSTSNHGKGRAAVEIWGENGSLLLVAVDNPGHNERTALCVVDVFNQVIVSISQLPFIVRCMASLDPNDAPSIDIVNLALKKAVLNQEALVSVGTFTGEVFLLGVHLDTEVKDSLALRKVAFADADTQPIGANPMAVDDERANFSYSLGAGSCLYTDAEPWKQVPVDLDTGMGSSRTSICRYRSVPDAMGDYIMVQQGPTGEAAISKTELGEVSSITMAVFGGAYLVVGATVSFKGQDSVFICTLKANQRPKTCIVADPPGTSWPLGNMLAVADLLMFDIYGTDGQGRVAVGRFERNNTHGKSILLKNFHALVVKPAKDCILHNLTEDESVAILHETNGGELLLSSMESCQESRRFEICNGGHKRPLQWNLSCLLDVLLIGESSDMAVLLFHSGAIACEARHAKVNPAGEVIDQPDSLSITHWRAPHCARQYTEERARLVELLQELEGNGNDRALMNATGVLERALAGLVKCWPMVFETGVKTSIPLSQPLAGIAGDDPMVGDDWKVKIYSTVERSFGPCLDHIVRQICGEAATDNPMANLERALSGAVPPVPVCSLEEPSTAVNEFKATAMVIKRILDTYQPVDKVWRQAHTWWECQCVFAFYVSTWLAEGVGEIIQARCSLSAQQKALVLAYIEIDSLKVDLSVTTSLLDAAETEFVPPSVVLGQLCKICERHVTDPAAMRSAGLCINNYLKFKRPVLHSNQDRKNAILGLAYANKPVEAIYMLRSAAKLGMSEMEAHQLFEVILACSDMQPVSTMALHNGPSYNATSSLLPEETWLRLYLKRKEKEYLMGGYYLQRGRFSEANAAVLSGKRPDAAYPTLQQGANRVGDLVKMAISTLPSVNHNQENWAPQRQVMNDNNLSRSESDADYIAMFREVFLSGR